MTANQAKAILAYIASLEEHANWESIILMVRDNGFTAEDVDTALAELHAIAACNENSGRDPDADADREVPGE